MWRACPLPPPTPPDAYIHRQDECHYSAWTAPTGGGADSAYNPRSLTAFNGPFRLLYADFILCAKFYESCAQVKYINYKSVKVANTRPYYMGGEVGKAKKNLLKFCYLNLI